VKRRNYGLAHFPDKPGQAVRCLGPRPVITRSALSFVQQLIIIGIEFFESLKEVNESIPRNLTDN
jgi:hypothetical protein